MLGWSVVLVAAIAIAVVVWMGALATRVSARLAFVGALAGVLLCVGSFPAVAGGLGIPVVTVSAVGLGALIAIGIVVLTIRRHLLAVHRADLRVGIAVTTVAGAWVLLCVLAQFLAGASQRAWVLNGDGFNNIWAAARLWNDGALIHRLPASSLAVVGSPSGDVVFSGATAATGVESLVVTWIAWLAVWSIVAGLVGASLVTPEKVAVRVLAAAGGALLPFTAALGGLAREWGYYNAAPTVAVALLSWLVLRESQKHPIAALLTFTLLTGLAMRCWEPTTMFPVVAALVVLLRSRTAVLAARGLKLWLPLAGVAHLILTYLAHIVPRNAAVGGTLSTDGQLFPPAWLSLGIALVACVLVAVVGRSVLARRVPGDVGVVVAAVVIASIVTIGLGGRSPLTDYYPVKLSWMSTLVVVHVLVALLVGYASAVSRRPAAVTAVVLAGSLVSAACIAPTAAGLDRPTWQRQLPATILGDYVWASGDAAADTALRLAEHDELALLWRSDRADEAIINAWAVTARGMRPATDTAAWNFGWNGYVAERRGEGISAEVHRLCAAGENVDAVIVYTADVDEVQRELATCTTDSFDIRDVAQLDRIESR